MASPSSVSLLDGYSCGEMFRYYPQTDTYEQIYSGEPVGGFTIQEDGSLLLFKPKNGRNLERRGKLPL